MIPAPGEEFDRPDTSPERRNIPRPVLAPPVVSPHLVKAVEETIRELTKTEAERK